MKGPLFVRPNLKWIVVGALFVAAVHQLTTKGHSEPPKLAAPVFVANYRPSEDEIQQLLAYTVRHPSPELYMRLSKCYENRGEVRKALLYLREAEKVDEID